MERIYYVYIHSLDDGTVFYVGQGKGDRAYAKSPRNKRWDSIVNHFGYEIDIYYKDLSEEESLEKEKELILKYGRIDNNTGTLINYNFGGIGQKGEDNYFFNKQLFGKDNGNFGNKYANNPLSIAIYRLDLQGNILYSYESAKEAEERYGYISSNITECCNGKRGLHKGFQFIKQKDYTIPNNHIYIPRKTDKQPVVKLIKTDKGFIVKKCYESSQAVEVDGYSAKCVNACTNGSKKTYQTFYWKKIINLSPKFQKHIMKLIESKKI